MNRFVLSQRIVFHHPRFLSTFAAFCAVGVVLGLFSLGLQRTILAGTPFVLLTLALYALLAVLPCGLALTKQQSLAGKDSSSFGWANTVTLLRLGVLAAVLGLFAVGALSEQLWLASGLLLFALVSDGLDGWLARKLKTESAFGARFDMEVDGLAVLIVVFLLIALGKASPLLVLAGLYRYIFLLSGKIFPWMRKPLPESLRRKSTFVIFIVLSLLALLPPVPIAAALAISWLGFIILTMSFAYDVLWLFHKKEHLPCQKLSSP